MPESITVGELLVRIRADVNQLDVGLRRAQGQITSFSTGGSLRMQRLETAFRMLGFQAVGLTGRLGRIASIIAGFGGFRASAALAVLGAIGLAWKAIADRAKEAREEMDKNLATLRSLATMRHERIQGLLQAVFGGPDIKTRLEGEIALQTELLKKQAPLWQSLGIVVTTVGKEMLQIIENLSAAWADLTISQIPVESLFSDRMNALRAGLRDLKPEVLGKSLGEVILPGKMGDVIGRDIGSIIASDQNIQRIVAAFQAQHKAFVAIGNAIGLGLQEGIYAVMGGGNFFKGLFRTILGVGIGALTSGIGGAITGLLTRAVGGTTVAKINLTGMPPAATPMAAARDAVWQRFIRESVLVAESQGLR